MCVVLVGLAAFILWPYFAKMTTPDESTFIYEGLLTSRGAVPYRDFFDFVFPGTFYGRARGILYGYPKLCCRFGEIKRHRGP